MNAIRSNKSPIRRRAELPPIWSDNVIDLLPDADAAPLATGLWVAERRVLTLTPRTSQPWLSGYPRLIHIRDTAGDRFPGCGILGHKTSPIGGQSSAFEYLKLAVVDSALSRMGRRHIWAWSTTEVEELLIFIAWLRDAHNMEVPTNVWLGTRIQTTNDLNRVPKLLRAGGPDTKRFIVLEPTHEHVDLESFLGGIDWCIAGQSPQPGAFQFDANVARRLRDHCRRARTKLFVTSISSSLSPITTMGGKNWYFWPSDLQIRAFPAPTCVLPGRDAKKTMRAIETFTARSIQWAEAGFC